MASATHTGKKIARLRELRNMKQETLADALGISQQAMSRIEQTESIEDTTLSRVAKALGLTPEAIKNFDEEKMIMNIQNNYEGSNQGATVVAGNENLHHCTFNPLDKLMETVDELKESMKEKEKLYEQLLKEKEERIRMMEGK